MAGTSSSGHIDIYIYIYIIIANYDRSLSARRLWEGTSIFRNARDSRRRRFRAVYNNRISNALCTRIDTIEYSRIKLSRFTSDYIISWKTPQYISYDPYFEAITSVSIDNNDNGKLYCSLTLSRLATAAEGKTILRWLSNFDESRVYVSE